MDQGTFGAVDILIIGLYVICIVGLGVWIGLRKRQRTTGEGYFLAGGSLTWPLIGLALFSTNISTIHLISLAQEGYINGLAYGNFEWMAVFTLVALSLFFAPFYIRSRVLTLPDFLEKRYSRSSRDWLAVLSIVSAIFIHIGFSLYTGAIVLEGIFGIENRIIQFIGIDVEIRFVIIAVIAGITGLYTIIGGLLAVVLTESIQTIILLIGSICIVIIGLQFAGGWKGVTEMVEPVKMTVLRRADDPSGLPWYSVLLGYPVIGLWYWCADQTIVQRVLGAKSEFHARIGPLFAGFLKILPVFLFVFPGIICLALIRKGIIPELINADGSDTYSHLITHLLPVGIKGIVAAALLAALMGTVSGALNSMATLFSYDLYKRFRPEISSQKLVRIGKIATFVGMILAILWSPLLAHFKSIFQGIIALISYIAPPITAVFVFGIFWKKASAFGAKTSLYAGSFLGLIIFVIDWNKNAEWLTWLNYDIPAMMMAFYLFIISSLILIGGSFYKPHKHTEVSIQLVWNRPFRDIGLESKQKTRVYKILVITLLVSIIIFYIIFR